MVLAPDRIKTKLMVKYWRYLPRLGSSLTKILKLLFDETEELYHAYNDFPNYGLKKVVY